MKTTVMNRRLRIAKPFRFLIFLLILTIGIIGGISVFVTSVSTAAAADTYMQVEVEDGDTLWSIACEFCDESVDVRDAVNEICEINDIEAGEIEAGDLLFIPLD